MPRNVLFAAHILGAILGVINGVVAYHFGSTFGAMGWVTASMLFISKLFEHGAEARPTSEKPTFQKEIKP